MDEEPGTVPNLSAINSGENDGDVNFKFQGTLDGYK